MNLCWFFGYSVPIPYWTLPVDRQSLHCGHGLSTHQQVSYLRSLFAVGVCVSLSVSASLCLKLALSVHVCVCVCGVGRGHSDMYQRTQHIFTHVYVQGNSCTHNISPSSG